MLRTLSERARRAIGRVLGLLILLAAPTLAHAQPVDAHRYTTEQLIPLALANNPELSALHERWLAALARADAARSAWPQPRISYSAYLLAVETRQGPQRHVVALSQAFPWLRALRDAADPALAEADALAAEFDAAALRVAFDIEAATLAIARLDALAELLTEQRIVYQDVAQHEAAVIPFGGAGHGDLLRTTLMVEVLTDRLADLAAERAVLVASLGALTRMPEDGVFDVAGPDLVSAAVPVDGLDADLQAVIATAAENDPQLAALDARARAESERAEVATRGALPAPTLTVGWGIVDRYDTPLPGTGAGGRDTFLVGLSLPLPVARRQYDRAEAAHLASASAYTADADALRIRLRAEVEAALIRLTDELARVERYERDLLPTAHEATEHYAISIAQGAGNHTEYLLAFEQELQLRVAVIDARYAAALERARLSQLTGAFLAAPDAPGPIDTYAPEETP